MSGGMRSERVVGPSARCGGRPGRVFMFFDLSLVLVLVRVVWWVLRQAEPVLLSGLGESASALAPPGEALTHNREISHFSGEGSPACRIPFTTAASLLMPMAVGMRWVLSRPAP